MRVTIFVGVVLLLLIVLLTRKTSQNGGIWKTIFTVLQIASVSANNRPNQR